MIIGLAIGMAALVLFLQLYLAPRQHRRLVYSYSYDRSLAEPGQRITLNSTVKNVGRLPILYVGLAEYFPEGICLLEDEKRLGQDLEERYGQYRTNYTLGLMPHRQFSAKVSFSLPRRGVYTLGKYYLESGDYLGVRSFIRSGELSRRIVIMPRRSDDMDAYQALGGYIGDISVRRLILEDPVLTVGCRDYTGREPMKAIAWPQTARSGKMLVKQYDHTVEASATVLLNLDGGTPEQREECLRLTRSACEELEKNRISYDFFTNGDLRLPTRTLTWLSRGLGQQHLRTILYGMGTSKCRSLTPMSEMVDRCLKSRRPKNSYILITPPMEEEQKRQLQRLRKYAEFDVCVLTGGGGAAQ